jgi:hypothetical protein
MSNTINYCGHIRIVDPTITITRHPYDRLISAYFYLIKGGGGNELDLSFMEKLQKYTSFKDFVMNIEKDGLINEILHICPMTYFLCDEEGKVLVTHIFKIEEIDKIDNFLEENGLEKLSEIHTNISIHSHYTEYLDREVIDEINKLYKDDFELFNYKTL